MATARTMRDLIRHQAAQPVVRAHAVRISQWCGPTDAVCRLKTIAEWVREHLRFIPDPVGVEAITTPEAHLLIIDREGVSAGDCDDAATLAGALARSVGAQVRIALASFRPDRKLHHTWAEGQAAARWIDLDPFRSERTAPRPSRLIYMGV
jgi:transglutaminase-like putative cysteine protease